MKYVYILQSLKFPEQYYTGITDDVEKRLEEHNFGKTPHTSKFKPWETVLNIAFESKSKAHAFEKYLKSGS